MKTGILWPREHGAYVQLLAPLVTAMVAVGASWAGVLFALAACFTFVANEALLVVLGHRGRRARGRDGARARRTLGLLVPSAVACGVTGLVLADAESRAAVAALTVPVVALVLLAWRRRERSLIGELVAAVALPGAAVPVAVAGGLDLTAAALIWLAWSLGFACTVIAVHRVIDRNKRAARRGDHLTTAALAAATVGLLAAAVSQPLIVAAIPLAAASALVAYLAPPAKRLRAIGFVLVGTSLCSAGAILALLA